MRRLYIYLFTVLCLMLCLTLNTTQVQAEENVTVYISVEKFSLGQGYIVKPVKVTVEQGTVVSEIVEKVLGMEGYRPEIDIHSSYGWYLAGIEQADNGNTQVPVSVMRLDTYGFGLRYPTGRLPGSENIVYPELAQFSYQEEGMSSGWFYYVNNKAPGYGMAYYPVEDQDVIRIQFTLCMGDLEQIPDIDMATKSLALISDYLQGQTTDEEIITVREKGLAVVSDMDAEKDVILQLQDSLSKVAADLADGVKDESHAEELNEIITLYDKTKAHDVECRMDQLPEETVLENQGWIEDVYSMYQNLTSDQLQWMDPEKTETFEGVLLELEHLKAEKEAAEQKEKDHNTATAVINKINAIGTVTLAKEAMVTAARKDYNALNPNAKAMIPSTVLSKLTAAEQKILSLKKEQEKKKYTPAKTKITKISLTKKKVKLTWKKITSASGYEVEMSSKKASGFKKIATIKKAKTVTYTKKKLKSGKTMYFRIRAYRSVGKTTYYGAYSTAKKVKIR